MSVSIEIGVELKGDFAAGHCSHNKIDHRTATQRQVEEWNRKRVVTYCKEQNFDLQC